MALFTRVILKETRLGLIKFEFASVAGTEFGPLPEFTVCIQRPESFKYTMGLDTKLMIHTKLEPRILNDDNAVVAILKADYVDKELKELLLNGVTSVEADSNYG